jgi:hypothetical protein
MKLSATAAVSLPNPGIRLPNIRAMAKVRADADPISSAIVALFLILIADTLLMLSSDQYQHWFLIPISICGVLIGIDAVDWVRGRIDIYDPVGIIGLIGVHFFYVAPLLHLHWDTWVIDSAPPPDWRTWFGYMGFLNVAGLVLYRLGRSAFAPKINAPKSFWKIDKSRFRVVLPVFVLISTIAQAGVYAKFGGIAAYMDSRLQDPDAWVGMGWIFMISESAPILIAFFLVVHLQQQRVSWHRAFLGLVLLFGVQMYFGGLRGSRSETVELFFWVVGCIHYMVRPVPRKLIFAGFAFLMVFLYFYAFYKAMGADATQALTGSESDREYIARTKHKTFRGLVLGDLARADIHAYILYRLVNDGEDFDYAKGRTYLGALAIWIPRFILPDRPDTKVKEGTLIQTGSGWDPNYVSSHVYGLAAEAMLNFGPIAAPLSYGVFGLLIGWLRRAIARLPTGDARFLLAPLGAYMCLGILLGDSDNATFGLAKNGLLPFLVIALSTIKFKRKTAARFQPSAVRT